MFLNEDNRIIYGHEYARFEDIKNKAKEFLSNPNNLSDLPAKDYRPILFDKSQGPEQYPMSRGVILCRSAAESDSAQYNEIIAELLQAIYELRNELSLSKYGVPFCNLTEEYQSKAIRKAVPIAILH